MANVTFHDVQMAFTNAEKAIIYADFSISNLSRQLQDDDLSACYCITTDVREQPKGVVIPAINELRYAGRHMIDALLLHDDSEKYQEQLRRSLRHCYRARFDALRATVLYMIRDFRNFSSDYEEILRHSLDIEDEKKAKIQKHRTLVESIILYLEKNSLNGNTETKCNTLQKAVNRMRPFFLNASSLRSTLNEIKANNNLHHRELKNQCDDLELQLKRSKWTAWISGIVIAALFFFRGILTKSC